MKKMSKKNNITGQQKLSQNKAVANWHALHVDDNSVGNELMPAERSIARFRSLHDYDTNTSSFSLIKSTTMAKKIKDCRSAYYNIGIIGNVIDIMTDFALEGLQIAHESEQAERLFAKWADIVNLNETVEEILRNMFRDGNVPVVHYDAAITPESIQQMKRVIASERRVNGVDLFYNELKPSGPVAIPYKFSVLDMLNIKAEGFDIFGNPNFYYQFPKDVVDATFKKTDNITQELLSQIQKQLKSDEFKKFKSTGLYPLKNVSMLYYKKDSSKTWAIPMLWRVIDDLKFKETLRRMDVSIAESIQNAIQIIKIGNVKEGWAPSRGQFTKLINMLKNPSKSKTIVWDDLISIESDYPDTGQILGSDKYQQVNADILSGLGISEVLIGGAGGNYSNSFLSCRTLLERLETARDKTLKLFVKPQLLRITKALNLRKPPIVKFAYMSLRDEKAEKTLLLELVDRNIISYRTLLEHFGEDFDIEVKRMRREDSMRKRLRKQNPHAIKKLGKFGPQDMEDPNLLETIDINNNNNDNNNKGNNDNNIQMPSAQGPQGQKGGRPSDGKEPGVDAPTNEQQNRRDTNPRGMSKKAKIRTYKAFMKVKDMVTKHVCASRNIKFDQLSDDDLSEIGDIALEVMARINNIDDIKNNNIKRDAVLYKVVAPAKLERCVKEVYKSLVERFKKRNGKSPSAKQRDKMRSSAYAICNSRIS